MDDDEGVALAIRQLLQRLAIDLIFLIDEIFENDRREIERFRF